MKHFIYKLLTIAALLLSTDAMFGETTASEIMTPRVDITDIDITSDFDKVMEVVLQSGYARIPVYEDTQDNIRG
ncbi:MAG: hypothetical protein IKT76_01895, partial [Bacteroides sp.]|nr:hypothetical protein [Bacteroides sp.]